MVFLATILMELSGQPLEREPKVALRTAFKCAAQPGRVEDVFSSLQRAIELLRALLPCRSGQVAVLRAQP